jgi:hypothetical protein
VPRYDWSLLRNRNVALLLLAISISSMGDGAFYTAVSYGVFVASRSVVATSTVFFAQTVPRVLFGSFAGVLADRMDRRRLLVFSDLVRAAIIAMVLAIPLHPVGVLDAIVVLETTVTLVFLPARATLLPDLVSESNLVAANALMRIGYTVSLTLGPLLGAFLFVQKGMPGVVVLDILTYLTSAVGLGILAIPPTVVSGSRSDDTWWTQWREGVLAVATRPWLRGIALAMFLVLCADGAVSPAFVAFIRLVLHETALAYGAFTSVAAVGSFLGGLVFMGRWSRLPPHRVIPLGMTVAGSILALLFVLHRATIALPMYAAFAFANVAWGINLGAFLQTHVESCVLGRVSAFMGSLQGLGMLIGLGLVDILVTKARLIGILVGSGLLAAVAGVVSYLAVRLAPLSLQNRTDSVSARR